MIENVETCQVFASQSVSWPCDDDDLSLILGQIQVTGFRVNRRVRTDLDVLGEARWPWRRRVVG